MVSVAQLEHPEQLRQAALLLEQENARLVARLTELTRELAELKGEPADAQLKLELARMQEQVNQLQRRLFGTNSERRRGGDDAAGKGKPQQGHGPTQQPDLPLEEVIHELDADERQCPACDGELVPMGEQFEAFEEIDVVERHFVLKKHRRRKYRCSCQGAVVTAPGPERLIPGGRYSLRFAVAVAIAKYLDHVPLDRQARQMRREGLQVKTSSLWDQVEALGTRLQPTHEALRERILAGPLLHADETSWRVMGQRRKKLWSVWCLVGEDAVYHRIGRDRSAITGAELFGDYRGIVMADRASTYQSLSRDGPGMTLVHCWSHARRKFVEAEPAFPAECGEALEMIGKLFTLEKMLPATKGVDGDELADNLELHRHLRKNLAGAVLDQLWHWSLAQRCSKESSLRKAINYMHRAWDGLTAFLEDDRIPLTNNAAERELRPPVVGRKVHYGSQSVSGARVTSCLYSMVQSAVRCGVDPRRYLLEAVRAAQRGEILLPHELS